MYVYMNLSLWYPDLLSSTDLYTQYLHFISKHHNSQVSPITRHRKLSSDTSPDTNNARLSNRNHSDLTRTMRNSTENQNRALIPLEKVKSDDDYSSDGDTIVVEDTPPVSPTNEKYPDGYDSESRSKIGGRGVVERMGRQSFVRIAWM
jgi:hypothetical protein